MTKAVGTRTIRITPGATALTIAGSDPSGGAGLQADLKTFQQAGVFGMSAVTLITVQNTRGVTQVETLDPGLIRAQVQAVLSDIPPRAIKVGALGSVDIVHVVAEELENVDCPIIVDPVLVSKHGHALADEDVVDAYRTALLPSATFVTPNRFETERLTGVTLRSADAVCEAIAVLKSLGVQYPFIKRGHMDGKAQHWVGLAEVNQCFEVEWLDKNGVHGAGCILSAAITAALAMGIQDVNDVVNYAIEQTYYSIWIDTRLGNGIHPADVRAMQPPGSDD